MPKKETSAEDSRGWTRYLVWKDECKEACKQRNEKKLGQILRKFIFLLINGSLLDIVSPRPDTETLRGHRPEASK